MSVATWRPDFAFQCSFTSDPNDPNTTPVWVDLSNLFTAATNVKRGRQYELNQNIGQQPSLSFLDRDEYLNPGNPLSPYGAGLTVYRQVLWQAMYPNGGTGNLLNSTTQGGAIDGSFESYGNGASLSWATGVGGTSPTVTTTNPFAGTKCCTTGNLVAGTTVQGISFGPFATIPGRQYTASAEVRPGGAFNLGIYVDTSPIINSNPYMETDVSDWTASNCALAQSPTFQYQGVYSLRITPNGGSASGGANTTTHYPVVTGLSYTAAAWVFVPAGWSDLRTAIDWYDSGNVFLSSSLGSGTSVAANAWTNLTQTFTAPASAAFAVLRVRFGGTPPATTLIYADAVTLQPAAGVYAGSSTAVANTYAKVSVTFVATQPTHSILCQTSGTVTATTVKVDNLQLEPGSTAGTFTSSGPVVYGVYRGYMERWPAEWVQDTQGFLGLAQCIGVDAFAPLNKINLSPEMRNSILAKHPAYYWTLSEPTGATVFGDSSGNSGPALTIVNSKYGAGVVTAGAEITIHGDPTATGVNFSGATPGGFAGSALTTAGNGNINVGASGASAFALTVAIWLVLDPTQTNQVFGFFAQDLFTRMTFSILPSLHEFFLTSVAVSGGVSDNSGTITSLLDNKPHLVVAQYQLASNTYSHKLWVDNVSYINASHTASTTFGTSTPNLACTIADLVGPINAVSADPGFQSTYAHWAAWTQALSSSDITDLWNAGQGYAGETSGARVARYLSYGWNGLTSVATGESVMGVSDLTANTPTLQAIQNGPTTTENGNFWVNSLGQSTFTARTAQYLETTSSYTFGEDVAGGEYPYQEGVVFGLDPTLLYDTVTIDNYQGPSVTVTDTTATAKFFPNAFQRNVNVQDPNEVYDAANYFLNQYGNPRQRVQSIVLNPMSYPALWPVIFSLEIGMRVTVKRRPKAANSGTGLVMSQDYFVESISHDNVNLDPAAGQWQTTLLLAPVDLYQVGILDNATYGLLDSTMILAY